MMDELQQNFMEYEFQEAIIRQPRQGWKRQFDNALQATKTDNVDLEWLDAALTDDEEWEW